MPICCSKGCGIYISGNLNTSKYPKISEPEDTPTIEELKVWHKRSGLPLKKLFNTSGLKYKELALKDKLSVMSDEEQLALLASDGMLIKRPILVGDDFVLIGFREAEWDAALGE